MAIYIIVVHMTELGRVLTLYPFPYPAIWGAISGNLPEPPFVPYPGPLHGYLKILSTTL